MTAPKTLVLRAPGTNCDIETAFAFQQAGARVESIHLLRLRENPRLLADFQILALPGGFSYGDDVAAGKILANQLAHFLSDELRTFRDRGKLILGICNGFQVLLKAGLLLPPDEDGPVATLTHNTSGRYEDRWVHLQVRPGNCPFLTDCERLELPVGHGEGRFVTRERWFGEGLRQSELAAILYVNKDGSAPEYPANPNGSQDNIAGIRDASGQVLGLMPHPDRHLFPTQHPNWTRRDVQPEEGDGMIIFRNAVGFFE